MGMEVSGHLSYEGNFCLLHEVGHELDFTRSLPETTLSCPTSQSRIVGVDIVDNNCNVIQDWTSW